MISTTIQEHIIFIICIYIVLNLENVAVILIYFQFSYHISHHKLHLSYIVGVVATQRLYVYLNINMTIILFHFVVKDLKKMMQRIILIFGFM